MTAAADRDLAWIAQYDALVKRAGVVRLDERTQIELKGADRATFLHNLTTNEIRKLAPGTGCEAFLTTVQGKTLAHAFIFAAADSLIIDTVPGQSQTILAHLEHYLVSEQVAIEDRTHQWAELLLGGPQAESLLAMATGSTLPPSRLAHAPATLAGRRVWLRRADLAGPTGFLIVGQVADIAPVYAAIEAAGAAPCGPQAFQAARIEWGFPLFGGDISDKNLPQEVGRDALAISFVKGCYLGQETVARIDALGHVNRTLVGVHFEGATVPPVGLELSAAGTKVGEVTSATWSPRLSAPLALGYVRRGWNVPGARLTCSLGDAEVVPLPIERR